jgi:glucose-6-phosphate isomerase
MAMEVTIGWENAHLAPETAMQTEGALGGYITGLNKLINKPNWSASEASLLLAGETKFAKASIAAAKECKAAELFILIGIGGSNLGAMAAYEFMKGQNAFMESGKKILFLDTCDPSSIEAAAKIAKKRLSSGKAVVFNIVSKSGATAETLANFEAMWGMLTQKERAHAKIFATTDAGSKLHSIASKKGWKTLPIPPMVGGRYSVFSPAGLFPLAWAGVDVLRMLQGADRMLKSCLLARIGENPALAQAALMHAHCTSGRNILVTFNFSNSLASYGLWWRQLVAESAGKCDSAPTPVVSIGSTDLHSQAQLYLGGPKDKAFRFVSISSHPSCQQIPQKIEIPLSKSLAGKNICQVYSALLHGTKASFENNGLPFWEIAIPEKSEEAFGALLMLDMVSVMLFCRLLGVDAFDQPAVEDYKKEVKRLLE